MKSVLRTDRKKARQASLAFLRLETEGLTAKEREIFAENKSNIP